MSSLTNELARMDASAQAELVRRGEVAPVELVEAAIERIERVNPQLNAVITPLFDEALVQAESPDLPDGPFRGVPLLLKDFRCEVAGTPYYAGMKYLRDLAWRSTQDTYLATKFRQAGFVFVGKTNLPELAGGPLTEPIAFGPTRNPWNLERTPGGSSGGSAAAVAAGMTPVAHANDGTGSIRIPASCCGLIGLKPSRGRITAGPLRDEGLTSNIVEFAVTRTVRDTANMLDALAGAMAGDLNVAPTPTRPYRETIDSAIDSAPEPLRVGLMVSNPILNTPVHPECVTAVETTGQILETLGHHVAYDHPAQLSGVTGLGLGLRIISTSGAAAALDTWADRTGHPIGPDDVEPKTWEWAKEGRTYSAPQVHQAYQRLVIGACGTLEWWQGQGGFDLLITPMMGSPPIKIGETDPDIHRAAFGLFTMPYSFTGQPAISLPIAWSEEALPIGVQVVADYGREDLLLQVAAQLERATGWTERYAPVFDLYH